MQNINFDVAHLLAGSILVLSFVLLYQDRITAVLNVFALQAIALSLSQDTELAKVLIAVIPIVGVVFFVIMRNAVPLFQQMQVKIDRLNLVLDEGLTGVRVIRAFDRGAHESPQPSPVLMKMLVDEPIGEKAQSARDMQTALNQMIGESKVERVEAFVE